MLFLNHLKKKRVNRVRNRLIFHYLYKIISKESEEEQCLYDSSSTIPPLLKLRSVYEVVSSPIQPVTLFCAARGEFEDSTHMSPVN